VRTRQARDRFKEELGTVRSEASRHADIAQENAALKRRLEHQTVRAMMPSQPRVATSGEADNACWWCLRSGVRTTRMDG